MAFFYENGRFQLIDDTDGRVAIDSDDASQFHIDYLAGNLILPAVLWPQNAVLQDDYDLGPVDPLAESFDGYWWVSDNGGRVPGSTERNAAKDNGFQFFFWYVPRLTPGDVYSASGPTLIDFMRPSWNVSPAREVGDRGHTLEFYLENGRMKARRAGINIAHYVAQGQFVGGPNNGATFGPVYECVELTVQFRLWLGAFD